MEHCAEKEKKKRHEAKDNSAEKQQRPQTKQHRIECDETPEDKVAFRSVN